MQAMHSGIALKKLQAKSLSLPSKLLTPSVHWTPHSSPWTKVKRSRYVWTKEFLRRTKNDLWKGKTRSQISASGSWLKTSCLKWWGKRNAQDVQTSPSSEASPFSCQRDILRGTIHLHLQRDIKNFDSCDHWSQVILRFYRLCRLCGLFIWLFLAFSLLLFLGFSVLLTNCWGSQP